MKEKLQQVIRKFRLANPQTRRWPDDQVVEAMFLIAARQTSSRITVAGRGDDGKPIFQIDLAPDASDALL